VISGRCWVRTNVGLADGFTDQTEGRLDLALFLDAANFGAYLGIRGRAQPELELTAAVVIELALYRELFTAGAYAPGFRPWDGRSPTRVAGMRTPEGNKTPVVRQEVLQPMLAAALYLSGTIGPRVVALGEQVRRRRAPASGHRASAGDIAEVLGRHHRHGQPLEAARPTSSRHGSPAAGIRTTRCSE
jgi:hypothetical protein